MIKFAGIFRTSNSPFVDVEGFTPSKCSSPIRKNNEFSNHHFSGFCFFAVKQASGTFHYLLKIEFKKPFLGKSKGNFQQNTTNQS